VIVEDLGREGVVDENGPIPDRYSKPSARSRTPRAQTSDTIDIIDDGVYRIRLTISTPCWSKSSC